MIGVAIIVWPRLTVFSGEGGAMSGLTLGVLASLASCVFGAFATMQVRKLVDTERSATIVLYFSITCSIAGLLTLPFGWSEISWQALVLLALAGFCGGIAQLLLTASYRYADVSTIAPFEYTSIVLGLVIGYFLFGDVPTGAMLVGTVIVVIAGIFVILREHRLGLQRRAARKHITPQG
jgi:drug/metabolite transporter (DMT)-like permease